MSTLLKHLIFDFSFSNLIWKILDDKKTVYLTFDDGPTEKVTRKILEILKHEKVKATFFVWKNVEKHPIFFASIKKKVMQ